MLLKGKIALITGASKGIGLAISIEFARQGANLILLSRNAEKLLQISEMLQLEYGVKVDFFVVDLKLEQSIKDFFSYLNSQKISFDILVNNAGIMSDFTLQTLKKDSVEDLFQTNVFSVMYMCHFALRNFLKQRKGVIINIASIIGTNGAAGQSVYSSTKAAIIGFSKSISKELAPLNIRVNCIAPGFINTEMTSKYQGDSLDKITKNIGFRKAGSPENVAESALFLASDLSNYITGQVLGVDGGMII